jgi:short-chain Z-isoprenyl diphosphate synthase
MGVHPSGVLCAIVSLRRRVADIVYGAYEKRLKQQLNGAQRRPRHVAVILDGNRRWARQVGFEDVNHGHRVGAGKIADFLGWADDAGVEVVTLFLLSKENLENRAANEVAALLEIIPDVADELAEDGNPWPLRMVGALDALPREIAARLTKAASNSEGRTGIQVNIAVGYGGRQEITDAVRNLLRQHAELGTDIADLAERLSVDDISSHLYTSGVPDPDLLIRTSGEQRLSGFLLWQSAYSEYWFCEAYWPEFRRTDFLRAMRDYAIRHRRLGH